MLVESLADTLAMISSACAQLGERALVCSADSDFSNVADFDSHVDHVKVVRTVNYAAIFPACRAVVHHGSTGTTAAGLRAGVPTLILWTDDTRSGDLGISGQTTAGGHRPAPFEHHPGIAGYGPEHHPCPALPHPRPRDRHPDDQTRRQRRDHR